MMLAADYASRWISALALRPRGVLRCLPDAPRDYFAWRAALENGRTPIVDEAPWVTFGARRLLDDIVGPGSAIFEYGAGGSTLYFARRAQSIVTVEHDPVWLESVRAALVASGTAASAQLRLALPEAGASGDASDPAAYVSSSPALSGYAFRAYASTIDGYPGATFDLVSIDGRARPSCIDHAWRKVKPGGYLLLDNSERCHYARAARLLEGWERLDCFGPAPYVKAFFRTTLWRR